MKNLFLLLIIGLALTGCVSPTSYVDPHFGKSSYSDVMPVFAKYEATIAGEFQTNGVVKEGLGKLVRDHVENTLKNSGVIIPSPSDVSASLKVTVNNIADLNSGAVNGFLTGLTFGATGSLVSDYYEVIVVYTDEGGTVTSKKYNHALHTTIGNSKALVSGALPTNATDGFATIVEQVILNFITDMQKDGKFAVLVQDVHKYTG